MVTAAHLWCAMAPPGRTFLICKTIRTNNGGVTAITAERRRELFTTCLMIMAQLGEIQPGICQELDRGRTTNGGVLLLVVGDEYLCMVSKTMMIC